LGARAGDEVLRRVNGAAGPGGSCDCAE